jgi:hypothetical protein
VGPEQPSDRATDFDWLAAPIGPSPVTGDWSFARSMCFRDGLTADDCIDRTFVPLDHAG